MHKDEQNNYDPHDDFDAIEMVDLVTATHEPVQPTPVRVTLRSRLTRRQRIVRGVVSASIVIVAFVLILNSIAPVHSLFTQLAGTRSTPTPATGIGSNTGYFYLDASPTWGTLYLDGHPLQFTTITAVHLAHGRHSFVWQANPFQPIRCTLSVPVSASDTCRHIPITWPTNGFSANALEVTFYDSLNMLLPDQQTALTGAIQAALDTARSTTTVEPGEQFVHFRGNQTTEVATQPLQATLHFDLSVNNISLQNVICANTYTDCSFLHRFQSQDVSQNCAYICTEPDTYTSMEVPPDWQAVVIAYAHWDYTTMNGRVIATDQPDSILDVNSSAHFVFLDITHTGSSWQAGINEQENNGFNSPACLAASNEFYTLPQPANINGFGFAPTFATKPATGCVLVVVQTPADPASSAPANPPAALCIYRFGVILAANALAHRYWPTMPLANAYEQSIATQLAKPLTTP